MKKDFYIKTSTSKQRQLKLFDLLLATSYIYESGLDNGNKITTNITLLANLLKKIKFSEVTFAVKEQSI